MSGGERNLGSDAEQLRYKARLSADIIFATHLTRPFRIMFTVSIPSSVRHAL